jgi:cellulose biosynthesis protein BcsQ
MTDLMLTPGAHVTEIIVETSWKVDLAPAESTLARVERELQSFKTLRKAMNGLDGYGVVLMDCPPSLGR